MLASGQENLTHESKTESKMGNNTAGDLTARTQTGQHVARVLSKAG